MMEGLETQYKRLREVLDEAFAQATQGKGKDRHATGEDVTRQPTLLIHGWLGGGFCDGQAIKKIVEARRLSPDRKRAERLGAIVYTAFAIIAEEQGESHEVGPFNEQCQSAPKRD